MLLYQSRYAKRIEAAFNANPSATNEQLARWAKCHPSTAARYAKDLRAARYALNAKPAAPVIPVVQDHQVDSSYIPEARPEVVAHECLEEAQAAVALEDTANTRAALKATQATVDAYKALREVLATANRASAAARAARTCQCSPYSGHDHRYCTPTASDTWGALYKALGTGASSERLGAWLQNIGDQAYGASLKSRPDATRKLHELRQAADAAHARELATQAVADKAEAVRQGAWVNYTAAVAAAVALHPVLARPYAERDGAWPHPTPARELTPGERALRSLPWGDELGEVWRLLEKR